MPQRGVNLKLRICDKVIGGSGNWIEERVYMPRVEVTGARSINPQPEDLRKDM
jgi:hypothetical protein